MSLNRGPTVLREKDKGVPGLVIRKRNLESRNRPNQEMLVPEWLITSHVRIYCSSDWLFTCVGRFLVNTTKYDPTVPPKRQIITAHLLGVQFVPALFSELIEFLRNQSCLPNEREELNE
eukprot:sb/3476278/